MERRWERKCRGARRGGEASPLASLHEWPRHNNNDTAWRRRPRLPGEIGLLFCGVPSSARSPPRPPPQGKREIGQKRTRSAYSQTTFPSSSAASEQPSPTQYFYSPRGGPPGPRCLRISSPPQPPFPPLASPASSPTTRSYRKGEGWAIARPQTATDSAQEVRAPPPLFISPLYAAGKRCWKETSSISPNNKLLLISLS